MSTAHISALFSSVSHRHLSYTGLNAFHSPWQIRPTQLVAKHSEQVIPADHTSADDPSKHRKQA